MKEKINMILKIVIIVAILIIAGSIFFHYVIYLPKKQELKTEQDRQEKIESYKMKFQADCEKKYDELAKNFLDELNQFSSNQQAIDTYMQYRADICKEKVNWWDINSYTFCQNGKEYANSREFYVPRCIDYKIEEINLNP